MELPTNAEEYTQFTLKYSGSFSRPRMETFMGYYVSRRSKSDGIILHDLYVKVHKWIIYTIREYPEYVSVSAIHSEFECHILIDICGVPITACNISESYPEPSNLYWQAGHDALELHRKRYTEQS